MGAEAKCTAQFKGKRASGTARLETDVLQFRGGDLRLSIPFKSIKKISADEGTLALATVDGPVRLDLGAAAAKWARKIEHPPSRLEKIGVKPEWRTSALGVDDEEFLAELERVVALLSIGRAVKRSDAIFYGVTKAAQLDKIDRLKTCLKPNGALWIVRPKGRPEISEAAVMAAGHRAGLVDVKVVAFSVTHTAEKFVIPISQR
jgi:hypothetical protein